MTLIAYKDGVMCADSQSTQGGLLSSAPHLKIARREDGSLFGASGYASVAQHWMRWFLEGENDDPPYREEGESADNILIMRPDGTGRAWFSCRLPQQVNDDRFALGDPDYLRGVMDSGLSAPQAVKIACRRNVYSSYPLIELHHSGPPVIWISETEQGDPEEFFAACGVRQDEYIQTGNLRTAA